MPAKDCGIEAFLEMMAAERGAAANTLEAYRRDLGDYDSALAAAGKSLRNGRNRRHPRLSLRPQGPRLCGDDERAAAFGHPPIASLSRRRRPSQGRSCGDLGRAATGSEIAENPLGRRGRAPARHRQREARCRRQRAQRKPLCGAQPLPHRASLRDRPARFGARGAAEGRRAPPRTFDPHSRQGRTRAARAALRSGTRGRSRSIATSSKKPIRARRQVPGCFRPTAKAAI